MLYFKKNIHLGLILETKGIGVVLQRKRKDLLKKGKIFENLDRNVLNLNIF